MGIFEQGIRDVAPWRDTATELPPEGDLVVGFYGNAASTRIVFRDGDEWFLADGRADMGLDGVSRVPKIWAPIPALPNEEEIVG